MSEYLLTPAELARYEAHLREEERAEATVEGYLRDLAAFSQWLSGKAVTHQAVLDWRTYLLSCGQSPATVNRKLASLSGLLRFFHWEECRVRCLKLQRRVFRDAGRELSREEYLRLLTAAREQGRERLGLALETVCSTGIRVSELRFITVEAAKRAQAVIRLKGKVRTILLPGKLCRKLLKYAGKRKTASGEIFLTRNGKSLSRNQIWREMKRLCSTAGVDERKVFPHNLRHLFAVSFYRVCRDIAKLADMLGHSSIETTRIYLMTDGAEHARYLEQLRLIS